MAKIDLHMHSTYSDGALTPKELIDYACEKGLKAISITDHDRANANKEAQIYAKKKGIEYVPGIEITITPPKGEKELHMVGLFIDSENEEIKNIPLRHKEYSIERSKAMIEKLNKLEYKITFDEVMKETDGKHLGRPHIAKILMRKYPEEFKERSQVFNKLLGNEGKAFVKAKGTEMKQAIDIIHNAGGIALVAHPWYLGKNKIPILEDFVSLGGDGIELSNKPIEKIPEGTFETLKDFVNKHNIPISNGTDFHEKTEGGKEIGDYGITEEEFKKLKDYRDGRVK